MRWIRGVATVVGVLVLVLIGMRILTRSGEAEFSLPPGRAATETEEEEFLELHSQYMQIMDEAHVTGDLSDYFGLFIDDPGYDMDDLAPDCSPGIDDYRDQVEQIIAESSHPEQLADTGVLSCLIASNIHSQESINAWAEIRATASAEGHAPSIDELPDGLQPKERPHPAGIYPKSYIVKAMVHGAYAVVDYSPVKTVGSWQEHQLLHLIDGQWYIAGIWSSGNP